MPLCSLARRLLPVVVLAAVPGCDEMPRTTCQAAGEVRTIDINGDGKPDVRTILVGGREVCRESDLDFDGRPDAIRLTDGRRQWVGHDLDGDGRTDRLELRDGDTVIEELFDLDGDGKPDQRRHPATTGSATPPPSRTN